MRVPNPSRVAIFERRKTIMRERQDLMQKVRSEFDVEDVAHVLSDGFLIPTKRPLV